MSSAPRSAVSDTSTSLEAPPALALQLEDPLLTQRLKLVEDLWESVLVQECDRELVEVLQRLRSICSPEGQALEYPAAAVLGIVEELDVKAAIQAARAFALFFQLINITEQHYDRAIRAERSGFKSSSTPLIPTKQERFSVLFPYLKDRDVASDRLQTLLDALDIRLVFTAHPTEIVRHTIREKQRSLSKILDDIDRLKDPTGWEADVLRQRLFEEILLWWRTDELHQFKPTVLDEVDYTLHYFEEVLFNAVPLLHERLTNTLQTAFPDVTPPNFDFCSFGSWVGSDRDGNPSVTPEVSWQTACYQRNLVLERYIQSVKALVRTLSVSLHWSDVDAELLAALEQDQSQYPEVYESLSLKFRQEPYRLKLSYIQRKLELASERNEQLRHRDPPSHRDRGKSAR